MKMTKLTHRSRKGFTFVEMLLVVSLLSVIGASLYQAIANGVRIWNRAHYFSVEEDVAVFMDKFRQDLRHSLEYSQLSWEAKDGRELSFPALIITRADKKVAGDRTLYVPQIGMVQYRFDGLDRALIREEANYGQALEEEYGRRQTLAQPVEDMKLFYIYKTDGQLKSESGLRTGVLPSAVVVELTFLDDTGARRTIQQQVNMPLRDPMQDVF